MINLPGTFEAFLLTNGNSRITIKNYLSDLNHFLGWLELFLKSQNIFFSPLQTEYLSRYFDKNVINRYASYLRANSLPPSTINRRFSALRCLSKFLLSQGWIKENPTKELLNFKKPSLNPYPSITADPKGQILADFKKSLERKDSTPNTVKNYLSDIGEFLRWLESEAAT